MEILFTDNENIYHKSSSNKILVGNGIIISSDFIDKKELDKFNSQLNAIEGEASELMISELKTVSNTCPVFKVNRYLATRNNKYDIAYSLLYPNFKVFVTQKYFIKLMVNKVQMKFASNAKFCFELNDQNNLIQYDDELKAKALSFKFYSTGKSEKLDIVRNIYYACHHLFRKPKIDFNPDTNKNVKHILLVIYDTFNDVDLFKNFFSLIQQSSNVHLSIVQISSGIAADKSHGIHHLKGKNISTYKIEDFKNIVSFSNNDFYEKMKHIAPQYSIFSKYKKNDNLEIYYMYLSDIIKRMKPDVAIYDNTGEVGRVVSDVSRYYKIPSVNVEYALFSDDAIYMEGNIKYTARACLGQATIDIWKRRHDPSLKHYAIGFLKLDGLDTSKFNKHDFFVKYRLDINTPTIFFASTWGGTNELYNKEKRSIARNIAEYAQQKNWNFIVKKHPSEVDTNIEEELKNFGYDKAKVFEHKDLNLYQAILFSDIITTQFSGISVEAMYLNKSTIFYNLSDDQSFVDQIVMKDEKFIYSVSNNAEFESAINHILNNKEEEFSEIQKSTEKYLYKTDRKASERLLHIVTQLKYED